MARFSLRAFTFWSPLAQANMRTENRKIGLWPTTTDCKIKLQTKFFRMAWSLSFLGVLMMWAFWACVYMAQMYPLYKPILAPGEHGGKSGGQAAAGGHGH